MFSEKHDLKWHWLSQKEKHVIPWPATQNLTNLTHVCKLALARRIEVIFQFPPCFTTTAILKVAIFFSSKWEKSLLFILVSERLDYIKLLTKKICEKKAKKISTINVECHGKTWPKNIKTTEVMKLGSNEVSDLVNYISEYSCG